MEIILDPRQLTEAIKQVESSRTGKEKMLQQPAFFGRVERFTYLSEHVENLSATAALLKAVQDPTTVTPEELINIILEKPGVISCVKDFAIGKIPNSDKLLEAVQTVTIKTIKRQANRY